MNCGIKTDIVNGHCMFQAGIEDLFKNTNQNVVGNDRESITFYFPPPPAAPQEMLVRPKDNGRGKSY